jgi:hypothetical protein
VALLLIGGADPFVELKDNVTGVINDSNAGRKHMRPLNHCVLTGNTRLALVFLMHWLNTFAVSPSSSRPSSETDSKLTALPEHVMPTTGPPVCNLQASLIARVFLYYVNYFTSTVTSFLFLFHLFSISSALWNAAKLPPTQATNFSQGQGVQLFSPYMDNNATSLNNPTLWHAYENVVLELSDTGKLLTAILLLFRLSFRNLRDVEDRTVVESGSNY